MKSFYQVLSTMKEKRKAPDGAFFIPNETLLTR